MSGGQNGGSGGPSSDVFEQLAVVNKNYLKSIQNDLEKDPKSCLVPPTMNYLEFCYKIFNEKNLNEPVEFMQIYAYFKEISEQLQAKDKTAAPISFPHQSASSGVKLPPTTVPSFNSQNTTPFNSGKSSFQIAPTSNVPSTTSTNFSTNSGPPTSSSTFKFTGGGQNSTTSSVGGFSKQQPTTTTITFGSSSNPTLNTSASTGVKPTLFGTGSTFGFGAAAAQNSMSSSSTTVNGNSNNTAGGGGSKDDDEDESPPVPDHVPVVETDALYTKRVKLFVLEGNGYKEIGVGNLFLKEIGDKKCQVVIRADNSLGTILLNVHLNSIVVELKPPNSIIASVPCPGQKPNTYLIRVKMHEANELFDTLQKHKVEK